MASYSGTLTGGTVTTITDSGFRDAYITNTYDEVLSGVVKEATLHVTIDGSTPTLTNGLHVRPKQTLRLNPLVYPGITINILAANAIGYSVTTNA